MKTIDLIIPVYHSTASADKLIDRLNEWNNVVKSDLDVRVIFVEDGGEDGSYEYLLSIQDRMSFRSKIIRLVRNYGQHTAIAVGIKASDADLLAVIDDDLQHDPFELNKLIDTMVQGDFDLVYGQYDQKKHSFFRNLSSRLLKLITKNKNSDFGLVTSIKLMKSSVVTILKRQSSPIILVDVYLMESARRVGTCLVKHAPRIAGKSSYSNLKLIQMTARIILFHSSLPLKWIVQLGLSMSCIFFILSCYYVYQKFVNNVQVGFTSIIVAIFLSTGLILVSLGIIGEYIRRIWVAQHKLEQVIIAQVSE